MNCLKNIFNNRQEYLKYFKFAYYQKHPTYNPIKPKNTLQQLELMRDLRLWVMENAKWSRRTLLYESQCQHIQHAIMSIQHNRVRSRLFILIFVAFMIFYKAKAYNILNESGITSYDSPVLHMGTRGSELIHLDKNAHPVMSNEESDNWLRKDYFK